MISLKRNWLFIASMMVLLFAAGNSYAIPLSLTSASADPYDLGYAPIPLTPPAALTSGELAAISDQNLSTGFTFSSTRGEYSSQSFSVVGFELRFSFDISNFSTLDSVDFFWTGSYTWTGGNFPSIRLGYASYAPQETLSFGTTFAPDGFTKSAAISFGQGGISGVNFSDISTVINGSVVTFVVATDLGFSTEFSTLDNVALTTFEVSADATGTLGSWPGSSGPPGPSIPEPSGPSLIGIGLLAGLVYRRYFTKSQKS